ncbi:hypothetical protein Cadr_000005738 [Camelus dromedarius]|uniref:Uncharacterized protein n=1 Tax=Camelus dromedarius TaxID=9838 RepID=A0A5N4E289_CAMDR|nr:hypothetical protein Cadr_000005738 [Camelus dromedarius]
MPSGSPANNPALIPRRAQQNLSRRPMKVLYHSNSITGQDVPHVEHGIIGHVGQDVDDGDNGHGNANGEGQIPTANRIMGTGVHSLIPAVLQFLDSTTPTLGWGLPRLFPSDLAFKEGQMLESFCFCPVGGSTTQAPTCFYYLLSGLPHWMCIRRTENRAEYSARAMSPTENDEPSKEFSKTWKGRRISGLHPNSKHLGSKDTSGQKRDICSNGLERGEQHRDLDRKDPAEGLENQCDATLSCLLSNTRQLIRAGGRAGLNTPSQQSSCRVGSRYKEFISAPALTCEGHNHSHKHWARQSAKTGSRGMAGCPFPKIGLF